MYAGIMGPGRALPVSSQAFINKWSIPSDRLTGPRRTGGPTSLFGFDFQAAYACLHLTKLLNSNQRLVAIRYEGAQDVDLRYADGRERYVQLKNEPDAHYSLSKLRSALQGFAADLLEAGKARTLTFTLVARSNHIDAAVMRLRDGVPNLTDIAEVADLFIYSTQASSAPQCLVSLDEVERRELADQVLKQTTFEFGMGDEIDERLSFESHACTELARNGVAGKDLHNAFGALKAGLIPQREFTRDDVQEILKRFVGGAAIDLFEGRLQALTDDLLARTASAQRIQQYYAGAPLDWDIIAAHGDIERDQQDELIEQLSQPSETVRLVCIVAEPGAGKSTLAWRVAAELHRQHGAFVVRVRDKEAADLWYLMTEFYAKVGRPFYVLVDDLFRDPEVINALRELSPWLPITILATSRANEYHPHRLRGEVLPEPLKEPSLGEKERILQRLGKTRVDLTSEQQKRLNTANQFLVLMMEVTAGKELREIIRDTLERLRQQDESAYRAYEYLCFTYQYSISIPESCWSALMCKGASTIYQFVKQRKG
jgi:Cap4-like dsDNA endonuclease family protein